MPVIQPERRKKKGKKIQETKPSQTNCTEFVLSEYDMAVAWKKKVRESEKERKRRTKQVQQKKQEKILC